MNDWEMAIQAKYSTRIKDAGIAIRQSRGRILFYTAGSRNGLEGVAGGGYPFENKHFASFFAGPGSRPAKKDEKS